MSLFSSLLGICVLLLFIGLVIFVIFGQVTVRKLRKKPETKGALGIEFASGWDILNVAGALAMPRWVNKKLRNTQLASLYADAELLDKHTNRFDRFLAALFYLLWVLSVSSMLILIILNNFGML